MEKQLGCLLTVRENRGEEEPREFALIQGDCIGIVSAYPERLIGIAPGGFNERNDRWLIKISHVSPNSIKIAVNAAEFSKSRQAETIRLNVPLSLQAVNGATYEIAIKEIKHLFA